MRTLWKWWRRRELSRLIRNCQSALDRPISNRMRRVYEADFYRYWREREALR